MKELEKNIKKQKKNGKKKIIIIVISVLLILGVGIFLLINNNLGYL